MPRAELVCLGRHGRDHLIEQSEINQRLVEWARSGRVVVRLKGGDPAIFGHLAEEVEALAAAGVEYQIVPGVTAASAAAGYAGIPLTCAMRLRPWRWSPDKRVTTSNRASTTGPWRGFPARSCSTWASRRSTHGPAD